MVRRFCPECDQVRPCDLDRVTAQGDGVYVCYPAGHAISERVSLRNGPSGIRVAYPEHELEPGCPCWFCRHKREGVA